jgi:hypothetical protein
MVALNGHQPQSPLPTIAFLAVVMVIALRSYKMDEVLKLWAALGTIAGIATGFFGGYFFTKEKVEVARAQTQAAQAQTQLAVSNLNMLKGASQTVKNKLPAEDSHLLELAIESAKTPTPDGFGSLGPRPLMSPRIEGLFG